MCLNPECRWITIIEDDKSGEKCYIHYKFLEDGSFEELFTEGDKGLKIYVDCMRDNKSILSNVPRPEVPHFPTNLYYPNPPNKLFNYPSNIAIDPINRFVMDYAGNILDMEEMNKPIELDIIDLTNTELILDDLGKSN